MGTQVVGLSLCLAASFWNLPTRGRGVQPPAAGNQGPPFSVYTRRSTGVGRAGGQLDPRTATGQSSSRAQDQTAPNAKHTRTHARARWPIRSHGVGRRFHSSSFIPPKARFPWPGRLHPAFPGGSEGPNCTTTRPHPPTATASSPPVYTTPQTRALPRSPASPLRGGRCYPGSP